MFTSTKKEIFGESVWSWGVLIAVKRISELAQSFYNNYMQRLHEIFLAIFSNDLIRYNAKPDFEAFKLKQHGAKHKNCSA